MNWLCRLLKCRDRDPEKLHQTWLNLYRDELMRQVDHIEDLLKERTESRTEIERLREALVDCREGGGVRFNSDGSLARDALDKKESK